MLLLLYSAILCGGAVALWLLRSPPDQRGPGSSPGQGYCVMFCRFKCSFKDTYRSHGVSLLPGVQMGTGQFNAGGNHAMDKHPIQGE